MARHHSPSQHEHYSCETVIVEDIAHDLARLDGTDKLIDGVPTLYAQYLRAAWIARRLSTMALARVQISELTELEGADGCNGAFADLGRAMVPDLRGDAGERRLWRAVFGVGFKRALDFLGRAGGWQAEAAIVNRWRNVTEGQ
jgi:hypothetical protein